MDERFTHKVKNGKDGITETITSPHNAFTDLMENHTGNRIAYICSRQKIITNLPSKWDYTLQHIICILVWRPGETWSSDEMGHLKV